MENNILNLMLKTINYCYRYISKIYTIYTNIRTLLIKSNNIYNNTAVLSIKKL